MSTHDLPYRRNVGIAVFNHAGLVLIAERMQLPGAWQMPQGGIDAGEKPWDAALRELEEEIGTASVEYLGETEDWLRYDFPPDLKDTPGRKRHAGQEQKWFAVRFTGDESEITLDRHDQVEFRRWRWAPLDEAVRLIVEWKRPVYTAMGRQFARFTEVQGS